MTTSAEKRISRRKVSVGGAIWRRTALSFIVNMSSVRSVDRRRSRSEIGLDKVAVEARLIDVDAVSRDKRSL
jgi:hypothetical protein